MMTLMNKILIVVLMNEIHQYRNVTKIITFDSILKINKYIESNNDRNEDNIYICKKEKIDWCKIDKKYHHQIFTKEEYETNILTNIMIPKHKKYDIYSNDYKNIPIIKTYDIVVRKMNFRLYDIIEITRKDDSKYYRRVF